MQIQVKYFAFFRERLGRSSDQIVLPESATVSDLLDYLHTNWPQLANGLKSSQVSVNLEFVRPETRLSEGDEVALIPPVSGGKPENLFKITKDSIVAQDVIDPIPVSYTHLTLPTNREV